MVVPAIFLTQRAENLEGGIRAELLQHEIHTCIGKGSWKRASQGAASDIDRVALLGIDQGILQCPRECRSRRHAYTRLQDQRRFSSPAEPGMYIEAEDVFSPRAVPP